MLLDNTNYFLKWTSSAPRELTIDWGLCDTRIASLLSLSVRAGRHKARAQVAAKHFVGTKWCPKDYFTTPHARISWPYIGLSYYVSLWSVHIRPRARRSDDESTDAASLAIRSGCVEYLAGHVEKFKARSQARNAGIKGNARSYWT